MIYLLLTIVFSAVLVLMFKVFQHKQVPVFQAIVVNYISASVCAFLFLPDKTPVLNGSILHQNWLWLALVLGSLFFTVFNLVSKTTVSFGVSTASVAMKLGLVFPVLLAFTIYGEAFNWLKLVGILLAFVAVVLSSIKEDHEVHKHSKWMVVLPFIAFLGSGLCDSLTQFANKRYVSSDGMEGFSFFLFVAAAIAGVVGLAFRMVTAKIKLPLKAIIGGVILGIFNYFSFLFLLKALAAVSWGSSVLFPVMNLGTVAFATIAGVLMFREKISKINLLGLFFAALSIGAILLSGK